ncbi:acyltransferase [candidate division WOR-3 bacterium]|nr:acyltransferase [candidate division WOR-3 bacterium]
MRIGVYQFSPTLGDVQANLASIQQALSSVEADLVVLPELCLSGYLFPSRNELAGCAEPIPDGPSIAALSAVCQARHLNLVLGLAEAAGSRLYNTAVLLTPLGTVHKYRKAHLFVDEKDLFDPGDSPFPVFPAGGAAVGMLICFDYFFPEAARTLALRGAQLVCHPANLVLDYAQSMTLTRAAENRVFWVLASRTGEERLGDRVYRFAGMSQVAGPDGRLLYRASPDREELAVIDIDPALALNKHATPRNHLFTDRRVDLYRL